ncbi:site-specific integrase [Streptomyces laculatispora]|uniref:site-specific integrase n=1 Tax=Streptomyces laculatispora TaxID=887464 RepID=UPI0027DCA2C6|nr:site-specific integrase [Streptomyces laculatispora]
MLLADTDRPKARVRRAWKRDGKSGYYLGTPKSRRGRRTLRVSSTVLDAFVELGLYQLDRDSLFWANDSGERLHYSSFYDRWTRAVERAKKDGVLPVEKTPTPHDLRHSHAAVLISDGRSLTYVQRRLGHESIKTTSDTYGHLLPQADDDAMDTIERSLGVAIRPVVSWRRRPSWGGSCTSSTWTALCGGSTSGTTRWSSLTSGSSTGVSQGVWRRGVGLGGSGCPEGRTLCTGASRSGCRGHADTLQDRLELRGIPALPGRDHDRRGLLSLLDRKMDLGGQPTP